ncbi:MAG TPA: response regulator [Syntrophales bacterium]|nr:response regulator [Syntrophales bacterium]
MKLLVVDDSSEIREILSATIELSGHWADEAYDGIEAIERLQNDSYEIVILDAEMPRMGGVDVCKFIKAQFPNVYVIGMSGCLLSLIELMEAGANICLSKPFRLERVEEIIENLYDRSLPNFGLTAFHCNNDLL